MTDQFFALLLHDQPEHLEPLKAALKQLKVETCCVRTLEEAKRLISQTHPHLVFTDTFLSDGSWVDVINLAEESATPLNVIVVSSCKDVKLYLSAIQRGAFDFVLPPFEQQSLYYVVQSAGDDARHRRHAQARAAVAC